MEPSNPISQDPMPRHVRIGLLLDVYGALLTERQREFVQLHYDEDQSFGEIAQSRGVSRQAVHDAVKHAEKSLEHYEKKLRLLERGWPRILATVEASPLPRESDGAEPSEVMAPEEWMMEAFDGELGAGGVEGSSGSKSRSRETGLADAAESSPAWQTLEEGLAGLRKRILRSGGIIYDADGLLGEVNRLLSQVREVRGTRVSDTGGRRDV
jgi:predicted DNA-binding protein YlxM (UPF0122 family)